MSQQGKGTKKSIQYDEDDDGNGSDDGYAKKMPAKLDDQKKPAAESEVLDLLDSSDDEEDTHGGMAKAEAKSAVYAKARPANRKKSYDSESDSSLTSYGGGRRKRPISPKGKPKRGDDDSDSDDASHASMDSFDRLEMQCAAKQKEAEKKKAASKSKKTKGKKQASVASAAAAAPESSSPDATFANVYNALKSKSDDDDDGDDDGDDCIDSTTMIAMTIWQFLPHALPQPCRPKLRPRAIISASHPTTATVCSARVRGRSRSLPSP